jgi:hypothetical protein
MDTTDRVRLGGISACIGGDSRYTDTITAYLNPDGTTCTVELTETGACGGMDGPGGSYAPRVTATRTCPAKDKDLIKVIKDLTVVSGTVQKYGKPTKRFSWHFYGAPGATKKTGLSAVSARTALQYALGQDISEPS